LPRSNTTSAATSRSYVSPHPGRSIVGTGAQGYSTELAEIAGLAVRDDQQGRGVGKALVEALVIERARVGADEVVRLTRKPLFSCAWASASPRRAVPLKVWADCTRCPRSTPADEVAVALTL